MSAEEPGILTFPERYHLLLIDDPDVKEYAYHRLVQHIAANLTTLYIQIKMMTQRRPAKSLSVNSELILLFSLHPIRPPEIPADTIAIK